MCRYRPYDNSAIRREGKGRAARKTRAYQNQVRMDEPATVGPQALTASRAAAVEQCCEVLLQFHLVTNEQALPRGRIEGVEIAREVSLAPAGMLLQEKYHRSAEFLATLRAS